VTPAPTASERRYVIDRSVTRSSDGRLLAGGAPARLVRLTAAGSRVVDAAVAGRAVPGGAPRQLLQRLDDQGVIHPRAEPARAVSSVTTVVPVRDRAGDLWALVRALSAGGPVVVVDDRSTDDSVAVARRAGARVVPSAGPAGPAAARNTGLAEVRTALVAFVDADCVVEPDWHAGLAALFDDPGLALAAPRVGSRPGASPLARDERAYSPLDLGDAPAVVAPRRRLTYVPSATLLCRRSALESVGGFDPEMRVGEDVDLVWRLVAAGWKVRYAPEIEVLHEPRASVAAFARQRYAYGTSAPRLERRHPGAAGALQVAPETVAVWAAAAVGGAPAALGALAASAAAAAWGVTDAESARSLVRLVARGHGYATRHLARVLVREWLPLTAVASLRSRRARRLAALAFLVDAAAARRRRGSLRDLPLDCTLRIVDHAAYAAGLWRSMAAQRSLAAVAVGISRAAARSSPGGSARSRRPSGVAPHGPGARSGG
jgi:mycofactocin glycosyltransferase